MGKPTNLVIAIITAGVLAATLVACGAGGAGSQTSSSVTKAQFIKSADAICARTELTKEVAARKAVAKTPIFKELKVDRGAAKTLLLQTVIPPVEEMVDELRGLDRPEGDEQSVRAIIAAYAHGIDVTRRRPMGVVSGLDPFTEADRSAARYGLGVCSRFE